MTNWLETEAQQYWAAELALAQRRLRECQEALVRCMSYVREDERKPCTEQKKRLQRAQERRGLCEQKLKIVRAGIAAWDRERTKNFSKIQRCRDLAESDLTVAINVLRDQIERLATYANLKSDAMAGLRDIQTDSDEANSPETDDAPGATIQNGEPMP